jgi:hypothetical protein
MHVSRASGAASRLHLGILALKLLLLFAANMPIGSSPRLDLHHFTMPVYSNRKTFLICVFMGKVEDEGSKILRTTRSAD